MLKFIKAKTANQKEVVIFTLSNSRIGVVDIVDHLKLTKTENGFCQLTDTGFFYFYGGNSDINTNIEMNEYLRTCKSKFMIYEGKSSEVYSGYLWAFIKADEMEEVSFYKGEETLGFNEAVESISQNFKNYFNA